MKCLHNAVLLSLLMVFVPSARRAMADTMVVDDNWDSGAESWASLDGDTIVTDPNAVGGNPDGWLDIHFAPADISTNPTKADDIIKVSANTFFPGGDWTKGYRVQFDFYAADFVPQEVIVRFFGPSAKQWGYTIDTSGMSVGAWTTFGTAPIATNLVAQWQLSGPPEPDAMLSDLQNMDWIGVYIKRTTGAEQTFGIDNFQLWIPEPAQLIMLAAALISTGVSCRRRPERGAPRQDSQ